MPSISRTRPHAVPFVFLTLTCDGRLRSEDRSMRLAKELAAPEQTVTDCFVLALGWANDPRESERWARQLFGLIDEALAPLAGQVRPRYLALHWAADPTANVERTLRTATLAQLLDLARWQIPRAPEEGAELDVLRSRLVLAETQPSVLDTARLALAFWLTMRRASDVGERVGRELLAPLWARGAPQPRVHLSGRYFGAPLLTAAILGGAPTQSLTLFQPALSAFAFADAVPGFDRPGFYHRIVDERRVRGPILVVSTRDDRRLTAFYDQGLAATRDESSCSVTRTRPSVASAAMGLAGSRGSGATDLDLHELFRIGLPAVPVVNIDAGSLTFDIEPRGGADREDHVPPELVKIALMAAGFGRREDQGSSGNCRA